VYDLQRTDEWQENTQVLAVHENEQANNPAPTDRR
jgi:hypothetical protein